MRRIKAILRLVFGFSSTETNAFIVLLPLMLIVIASEPVYRTYFMSNNPDDLLVQAKLDSIVATWVWEEKKSENMTDSSSGFSYKNKKQFSKKPYKPFKSFTTKSSTTKTQKSPQPKFDLNLADTVQLKSIYGIGPVIARRIITYRSSLGGFIMHEQLYEVWGLDSTVVSRLTDKSVITPDFTPNKLAINHCGEQELARHPYLRTKLARAIVNYRLQHGSFEAVEDLTKIAAIDEKAFQRIKPYIRLD
jgi:competence ComEA-like helix-hairpin-helix protein